MPDPLPDLRDDLEHAFNELADVASLDQATLRRKLAAYLDALYSLREYRKGQLKQATGHQVWERLVRRGHVTDGEHVEGHLVPRGNRTHSMTKMAPPGAAPVYPSDRLLPSMYLFPGQNLMWKRLDELEALTRQDVVRADRDGYFDKLLAGLPVLPAADIARRCLLDWEGFRRLPDATYMARLLSAALAP